MESTTAASACRQSLTRLAWFAASIVILSAGLSGIAHLWIDLPWWKIFRRCVSVAAALLLWVFMRRVHAQPIRSLGLGPWKHGQGQVRRGVLAGFGLILAIGSVYLVTHACRIAIHPDTARVARTLLGFLPAAGLVAVLEELIFRGYVLQQLLACSKPLALMASSAAYALVHLRPNPVWPSSAFELIGLFILGGVLAYSVLLTKQLYFAIGLHASLAYCARVNKLLVEFPEPSLQWLIGTNRLINGVVAWVSLLGVAWMLHRRGARLNTREG